MPQEFSCNYLDFLDSLTENRKEEAAKSLKIEESEKSFIDSALLLNSTKSPFVTISKSELKNNNLTNSAESQLKKNQCATDRQNKKRGSMKKAKYE